LIQAAQPRSAGIIDAESLDTLYQESEPPPVAPGPVSRSTDRGGIVVRLAGSVAVVAVAAVAGWFLLRGDGGDERAAAGTDASPAASASAGPRIQLVTPTARSLRPTPTPQPIFEVGGIQAERFLFEPEVPFPDGVMLISRSAGERSVLERIWKRASGELLVEPALPEPWAAMALRSLAAAPGGLRLVVQVCQSNQCAVEEGDELDLLLESQDGGHTWHELGQVPWNFAVGSVSAEEIVLHRFNLEGGDSPQVVSYPSMEELSSPLTGTTSAFPVGGAWAYARQGALVIGDVPVRWFGGTWFAERVEAGTHGGYHFIWVLPAGDQIRSFVGFGSAEGLQYARWVPGPLSVGPRIDNFRIFGAAYGATGLWTPVEIEPISGVIRPIDGPWTGVFTSVVAFQPGRFVRVAAEGCLNVLAEPRLDAGVIDCAPGGAFLRLATPLSPAVEGFTAVVASSGEVGWVVTDAIED
jgi:hypothetical protein